MTEDFTKKRLKEYLKDYQFLQDHYEGLRYDYEDDEQCSQMVKDFLNKQFDYYDRVSGVLEVILELSEIDEEESKKK